MSLWAKLLGRVETEPVTWIGAHELLDLLNGPTLPLIIDVRGPGEFSGPLGHIEGAENVPLDQFPNKTAELIGGTRPIVLVCHTDRRSSAAAEHLRRAGGSNIAVLRGGMVAWQSIARL